MRVIFQGGTLINGLGEKPVTNSVFSVENDCFGFVGNMENYDRKKDDKVIDVNGKYIIPGLIDCHIHMDLHGFGDTFQENLVDSKLRTLRAAGEMTQTLKAGFTTVRNVGSVDHIDAAVKAGIEAGYCKGPRIQTAGRIISMTCSGTEYFDGMYRIADGEDECRKAAREQLKQGADFLKIMATGAVMNPGGIPGAAQLDQNEIRVIVNEGLKLGRHTAAHAHGADGILNAVAAGVRTIEHGTMADDRAIEAMVKNGVYLVPTLGLHDLFEANAATIPDFILQKSRQLQTDYIAILKKAVHAGVKIALGTDAGTNYNYHGMNAHELVSLVENQIMTPAQAIKAATATAAEAIMVDDMVGTIEPGKLADFSVLDSDPLSDIRVLTEPDSFAGVYKGGIRV